MAFVDMGGVGRCALGLFKFEVELPGSDWGGAEAEGGIDAVVFPREARIPASRLVDCVADEGRRGAEGGAERVPSSGSFFTTEEARCFFDTGFVVVVVDGGGGCFSGSLSSIASSSLASSELCAALFRFAELDPPFRISSAAVISPFALGGILYFEMNCIISPPTLEFIRTSTCRLRMSILISPIATLNAFILSLSFNTPIRIAVKMNSIGATLATSFAPVPGKDNLKTFLSFSSLAIVSKIVNASVPSVYSASGKSSCTSSHFSSPVTLGQVLIVPQVWSIIIAAHIHRKSDPRLESHATFPAPGLSAPSETYRTTSSRTNSERGDLMTCSFSAGVSAMPSWTRVKISRSSASLMSWYSTQTICLFANSLRRPSGRSFFVFLREVEAMLSLYHHRSFVLGSLNGIWVCRGEGEGASLGDV